MSDNLVTGRVKFFDEAKGFGMILLDSNRRKIIADIEEVRKSGLSCLPAGARVRFERFRRESGDRAARNIEVIAPPSPPPPRIIGTVTNYYGRRAYVAVPGREFWISDDELERAGITTLHVGQRVEFVQKRNPDGQLVGVDVELVVR